MKLEPIIQSEVSQKDSHLFHNGFHSMFLGLEEAASFERLAEMQILRSYTRLLGMRFSNMCADAPSR